VSSQFNEQRRDLLKSTCTLAGAAAVVLAGGSLNAFAAGGAMSKPQAHGVPLVGDVFEFTDGLNKGNVVTVNDVVADAPPLTVQAKDPVGAARESDNSTVLLYRVSPDKIPAGIKYDTVDGIMAYSAVCTHLGCMLSNWDAATKQFLCPCHDALFDPLKEGANTGGNTSRTLPHIPVKAVDGKLVVSDKPSGYVGMKRG
jgi:rieske iron-sulfur protein